MFSNGIDRFDVYRGEMPLECDPIPQSKIFRLPVIFTYVNLTTTGDGIIQLTGDDALYFHPGAALEMGGPTTASGRVSCAGRCFGRNVRHGGSGRR